MYILIYINIYIYTCNIREYTYSSHVYEETASWHPSRVSKQQYKLRALSQIKKDAEFDRKNTLATVPATEPSIQK